MARSRSAFNQKAADAILEAICNGASLTEVSAAIGVPRQPVRSWLAREAAFAASFEAAKLVRVEALSDKIASLAASAQRVASDAVARGENPNAAVAAPRVESREFAMAAEQAGPETQYGDRNQVELSGAGGQPLVQREADPARVALSVLALLESLPAARTIPAPSTRSRRRSPVLASAARIGKRLTLRPARSRRVAARLSA
jgi:hypothetical protein